jgi:uncharacterized protein (TIGR03435 family)
MEATQLEGAMRMAWLRCFLLVTISVAAFAQTGPEPQQRVQSAPPAASAQQMPTAETSPEFEVATIKPSDPAACCARTFGQDGRRFSTTNTNLKWMLQWAYSLHPSQIVGGPAWIDEDRFNVTGVIEGTQEPTDRQWRVALQKLLMDRFRIQLHHESREMSAYAVVIARGGSKLKKSDGKYPPRTGFGGAIGQTMYGGGQNVTIPQFFGEVQRLAVDRPILDHTGLAGTFDIALQFTREDIQSLGMTQLPDNAPPNLFDALQQQLGLKLEGIKAPVDVLVIDHAEKPSED